MVAILEFKMAYQLAMTGLANIFCNTTTDMEVILVAIPMFSGSRCSVIGFRITKKWGPLSDDVVP